MLCKMSLCHDWKYTLPIMSTETVQTRELPTGFTQASMDSKLTGLHKNRFRSGSEFDY
ncbi:hypothetical protein [Cyclobacterium salsum]|uniref:hypothetical protein n=1 Tax=Cyclobacterium salsum TaxID=2666329 RepID=UPI0013907583|nr:hypothetical protein [Cyclobacterium salsum]